MSYDNDGDVWDREQIEEFLDESNNLPYEINDMAKDMMEENQK